MNLGSGEGAFGSDVLMNERYRNYGSATGAAVAGGVIGASSSSGSGNLARCPLDDTSLYCQLSKGTNIVSMIIYLLFIFGVIIAFLYFIYDYMRSSKGSRGSRGSYGRASGRR